MNRSSTESSLQKGGRALSWVMAKLYIKMIACAVVMILVMLWQHVRYTELSRALARTERERIELLAQAKTLEVERQLYGSPQRVARIASQELGLTEPNPSAVTIIPPAPCSNVPGDKACPAPEPTLLERWTLLMGRVTRLLAGMPPSSEQSL